MMIIVTHKSYLINYIAMHQVNGRTYSSSFANDSSTFTFAIFVNEHQYTQLCKRMQNPAIRPLDLNSLGKP